METSDFKMFYTLRRNLCVFHLFFLSFNFPLLLLVFSGLEKKNSLHCSFDVLCSPSLSRTLCSVVAETWSSVEAPNKPAALITEQFPKLCNNNSMPTVDGGFSDLILLTSGCSSRILSNMAWSIKKKKKKAVFQKTTEGAFVL